MLGGGERSCDGSDQVREGEAQEHRGIRMMQYLMGKRCRGLNMA